MARKFDPGSRQSPRGFGRAVRPGNAGNGNGNATAAAATAGDFTRAIRPPRLFDGATPQRRRRRKLVPLLFGATIAGIMAAAMVLDEAGAGVWLAALPAGFALFLAAGAVMAVARPHDPTLTCVGCGAVGWVEDIKAAGGRCPHCGATRFEAAGQWSTGASWNDGGDGISGHDICSGAFCVEGDSDSSSSGDGGDGGGDGGGGDGGGGD